MSTQLTTPLNYARHRYTGQTLFFRGYWRPRDVDCWATWLPLPGIRRIGEPELWFQLRCKGTPEARAALIALQETHTDNSDYQVHLADARTALRAK